ncbi:unnamed protein product [Cylicocyclus nassatus]|uniref:Integrase catalytic domain-containing protein n=1 Tax=Cylicocyclus nassatus TaxID=53992 RepID=A0AA36HB04_CYLNA|nr:unnamed protein product [Cylicocyclus nassatus]
MHVEAEQFKELWKFPTNWEQLENYILSNKAILSNLIGQIKEREEKLVNDYSTYVAEIESIKSEDKVRGETIEAEFDHYWEVKQGDQILDTSSQLRRKLEIRLVELECQERAAKRDADKETNISVSQAIMSQAAAQVTVTDGQSNLPKQDEGTHPSNSFTVPPQSQMFRYLYGHELRVPEFHGNPEEFESFWELFEELVHKQPYSDLEKLSILLSSCKGDAERALRMIPRNGHSYGLAVMQLKSQFRDERRNKTILLRKLQALPRAGEDPRQLQNTYNDILALVAEMRKQNEAVDNTGLLQTVLSKFSKSIQDEAAKREYDSKKIWSMSDLMENLDLLVKRRVHVGFKTGRNQEENFTALSIQSKPQTLYCVGCNGAHRFVDCDKYKNTHERRERLKQMRVCWICFSKRHQSHECHKQRCPHCGGAHHPVLCNRQVHSSRRTSCFRQRAFSPSSSHIQRQPSPKPQQRYKHNRSPSPVFRPKAQSPNVSFKDAGRLRINSPIPKSRYTRNRYNEDYRKQGNRSFHRSPSHKSPNRVRFVTFTMSKRDSDADDSTLTLANEKELQSIENAQCTRLMTVPVKIRNNSSGQMETIMALLDSASDSSFITIEAVRRLNLKSHSERIITVTTFGGRAYQRSTKRVEVTLFNYNGQPMEVTLLTHENITKPLCLCDLTEEDLRFLEDNFILTDKSLLRQTTVNPEILLGIDYFNSILIIDKQPIQLPSGFYVTPTFFGHVISGSHFGHLEHSSSWGNHSLTVDVEDLYHQYETFRSNEDNWVNAPTQQQEKEQIMNNFNSTVQIREHKIFVQFPWKENKNKLSDNFGLALSRLHQQFKLSYQNPKLWEQYCGIIEEQLKMGIIEEVQEKHKAESPLYYIPHQAVVKPSSHTTKVRIVLDASSKQKGELSLNDVIHQGPMLLPSLLGILIRARIGNKILIADVEKAFHTIYLQETERDAVRFLWLKDTAKPPVYHNIKIMRFQRLAFGINASPSLLAMSIKYYLDKELHSQISEEIIRNLYVDNVLLSAESTEEAINKYLLSKQIFKDMSMNLREYISNDPHCNEKINLNDIANHKDHKILGIAWDPDQDQLKLKSKLKYTPIPTKRSVLQAIHSTFDPLGFLTPLLLNARIFMQDLWQKPYKWDSPLSKEDDKSWRSICDEACDFNVAIPRKITTHAQGEVNQIHTFVDASIRSYAACVYMRTKNSTGTIESHLLIARSRLSPKKSLQNQSNITIPRLELMALELGMKLTEFVLDEIDLNIDYVHIYSDSQIVLCWVHTTKPKNKNDYATRGTNSAEIIKAEWMKGPKFLLNTEQYTNQEFPLRITTKNKDIQLDESEQTSVENIQEEDREECTGNDSLRELPIHATCTEAKMDKQLPLPVLSTWFETKRAMTNVLRFVKLRISSTISEENQRKLSIAIPELSEIRTERQRQEISTEEINAAEKCIIKMIQRQFKILNDKYKNLNLLPDPDGILRCFGRLQKSLLPENTRNPILLPPNDPITRLIVKEYHEKIGHQGVNGTIANIRTKFWIPTARQVVRKTLNSCMICKRWHAKPYLYPNSPSLPLCRSSSSRPFEHVGIDFAGPFYVRAMENSTIKVWTCLFTCMVTRAVHLEMVESLSAEAFVNSLRRFVARRGVPTSIISDNATNFQLGQEIINDQTAQNEIADVSTFNTFLSKNQIKWKFITPLSPWKGGFYERLVGIMKLCLRKIIGRRQLAAPSFQTFLSEAEAMINTRPLAYAGSDVDDSLIIRPIDFLIPHAQLNLMKEQDERMEQECHTRDNENETSGEEHEEMSPYVAMEVELTGDEDNHSQVKGEPPAHMCSPKCEAMESLHESIRALHEDVINLRKEIKMQKKSRKRKHESDNYTKNKTSKQPKEMDSLAAHMQVCAVEDRKPDMLHEAVQTATPYQEDHEMPRGGRGLLRDRERSPPRQRAGKRATEQESVMAGDPPSGCLFCNGPHWASNCNYANTLSSRRQMLARQNRCERCLGPANHLVTACQPRTNCFYCKLAKRYGEMTRHHTVLAFTTVHGCVTVEQATANVARCQRANAVSKPVPIYKGAEEPILSRDYNFRSENIFFGKDGIGDQPQAFPEVLSSDFVPTSEEAAALALVRLSREHPEATLVCLGPLTNVAVALKIDPKFTFAKVFIMGGNYYGIGNVESKSSAEFNFHGDPEAASIVISKLAERIVMIPWEAFFLEGVKHEKEVDFNAHLQYDTKLASFLRTATSTGRAALEKNHRQFSYCDEIAVAAAIDMHRVARKLAHLRVDVELSGAHTRGQVVVDWVDVLWSNEDAEFVAAQGESLDRRLPPVTFIVSYDVVLVDKWIHKAVKGEPGPW